MEEDLKIESVTFYKQIYQSTQVLEKHVTHNSIMAISLPRLRFLEKDGEYKPSWAMERDKPSTVISPNSPQAQHRAYKKETQRKLMYTRGGYPVTGFEQNVYDMHKQGISKQDICKKLKKQMSAITGALNRYEIKLLAMKKKK